MLKIVEQTTIIPAAAGSYATVISGAPCLHGGVNVNIEHPLIVAWSIDAEAWQVVPIFAGTVRADLTGEKYHNHFDSFIFLHDQDNRLRWRQGGQVFADLDEAKNFAVSAFKQQWPEEGQHQQSEKRRGPAASTLLTKEEAADYLRVNSHPSPEQERLVLEALKHPDGETGDYSIGSLDAWMDRNPGLTTYPF